MQQDINPIKTLRNLIHSLDWQYDREYQIACQTLQHAINYLIDQK